MDRTQRKAILNNVRRSGYAFEYRITIFGDKLTGKTSLLNRYMHNTFTHRYRPTVEEHITHIVEHNGAVCVCLFIDTCGGNDFPAMRRLEISKGNDFFLVYAINNRKSFDMTKSTLAEILSTKENKKDLKIVLIGTKTDLEDERQVSYNEGRALLSELMAKDIQAKFFEVGAKDDNNVEKAFKGLFDMYIPNVIVSDGRNTLPRKSMRRSRKKSESRKPLANKFELTRDIASFSESDLSMTNISRQPNDIPRCDTDGKLHTMTLGRTKRNRCNSDERSNRCNSVSPKPQSRFHAKHFILKTFGNMQRILGSHNDNKNEKSLIRSNTCDNSLLR